jgi:hypothetical protein
MTETLTFLSKNAVSDDFEDSATDEDVEEEDEGEVYAS